jgi:hypothetical protein
MDAYAASPLNPEAAQPLLGIQQSIPSAVDA